MSQPGSPPQGPPTGTPVKPRWRSPFGLVMLLVMLVVVPVGEIALLIAIGRQIGLLPILGILIAEIALGTWLVKREGGRAWRALSEAFGTGRMPTAELTNTALVVVGGVMLMLPGFITDLVGLFFLLPVTRPLARKVLAFAISRQVRQRYGVDLGTVRARMDTGNTIKGETVDGPAPRAPGTPASRPGDDGEVISGEIES